VPALSISEPIKVLGLALYGDRAASNRVRLGQFKNGLKKFGIDLEVQALLNNDYLESTFNGVSRPIGKVMLSVFERIRILLTLKDYDLIIVHCELFPFFPAWVERLLLRIPYIYDFDDAWFLRYQIGRFASLQPILGNKFNHILAGASAVIAGNSYLADYAGKFNLNVVQLPSVVDTNRYLIKERKPNFIFTVGWIGSPSSNNYLTHLIEPLERLALSMPLRFIAIGGGKVALIEGVEVVEKPWNESTEIDEINKFDVGLMPLPDDDWARGKCGYKLIQYMACGVPVIASNVGANKDIVSSDLGFLVGNSSEWLSALETLGTDHALRISMGNAARRRVESYFSLIKSVPKMAKLIHQVVNSGSI